MAIKISDRAKEQLKKLDAVGAQFLRVSVAPGGCSGMTYKACIDDTLKEGDQAVYEDGDLRVVAEAGSAMFLDGLEIDYSSDLIKSGFRFTNPNAVKSCGCGSSFGI
ncbi:MAG: iron-sulfur cluster assembly accessory protein [Verrucomicrobia bacterium]|nr:iron-sulfur cluster assembly accessory protein [Verrucomicrobiota bacterium]